MSRSARIEAFLHSGLPPEDWSPWAGGEAAGTASMRRLLVRIVQHRATGAPLAARQLPADPPGELWRRVSAMCRGLLQPVVADALERALPERLRMVTVDSLASDLAALSLEDGWCLANIVLEDMGAPPVSDSAPQLDGLCSGGCVWVPPGAFAPRSARVDVLVHEVAHLLHSDLHLDAPGSGGVGPLVAVPADQRETFAYACELWACLEGEADPPIDAIAHETAMTDPRVDKARLARALHAAGTGGWAALRDVVVAPSDQDSAAL